MADNKRGKAAFFSDDDFNVEAQVAVAKESNEENNTTQLHNTIFFFHFLCSIS